jgi:hypothetical protein
VLPYIILQDDSSQEFLREAKIWKGCWLGWSAGLTLRHAARVRAPAVATKESPLKST